MKKTFAVLLVLTGAFGASLAVGQTTTTTPTHTPPTPATIAQREVNALTRFLALTAQQQQEALPIFENAATLNAPLQTQLQTARTSLNTAVTSNNSAGITQAANTIGTLTAEITANNAKANAQFYLLLNQTQQSQYMQSQGRGFGGFGGGGPGPAGRFRGRQQ